MGVGSYQSLAGCSKHLSPVNHLINFHVSQSVSQCLSAACHSFCSSQFVSQWDLAWSPPPAHTHTHSPTTCSVLLVCHHTNTSSRGRVYTLYNIYHTIMLPQNMTHSLLTCTRFYVNYTPSDHGFVCGCAVFMCVECNLLPLFVSKAVSPTRFFLSPSFLLHSGPFWRAEMH